jgi:protein gp37
VVIFGHEFENELEALEYAIANQRNRRNLTDAEFLRCVSVVDERKKLGGDRKSKEVKNQGCNVATLKSHEQTAKTVGVSPRKVSQARVILDHATPKERETIDSGAKSVNQVHTEIQERRKVEKQTKPKSKPTFNRVNENIDWAKWSWNPVTGCKHNCKYCYARDIANRFYPQGFEPTFHPNRLAAPQNTKLPKSRENESGWHNVFVCSMADLFGDWVDQAWIDSVIGAVRMAPQWEFLFLTKNPKRLVDVDWPDNAWVGTTVDTQSRVEPTKLAFAQIRAKVKFLSCEPLNEDLDFGGDLSMFDWLIIGGRSKSTGAPAFQPPFDWVWNLHNQAKHDGLKVYWKPNLTSRPMEYPEH